MVDEGSGGELGLEGYEDHEEGRSRYGSEVY